MGARFSFYAIIQHVSRKELRVAQEITSLSEIMNVDKKAVIRRNAFSLLMEQGYAKTSYANIAQRSGCNRSLVQYYYPKKSQILIDFVERLIECSYDFMMLRHAESGNCFLDFFVTGQIHFYVLLKNPPLEPLTRDIVANRETSSAIIALLADWQHHHSGVEGIDSNVMLDSITFAMGGAYEYVYRCLADDQEIDVGALLSRTIRAYIVGLEVDPASFDADKNSFRLDAGFLTQANEYVLEHLLH